MTMINNDKDLLVKLIDDNEVQDIELQKETPLIVVAGIPVKTPSEGKKADRRRSGGCCKCLCKCFGITFLTFAFAIILSLGYLYFKLNHILDDFTVPTPQKFPIVAMTETELQKVLIRVDSFFDSVIDEESDIKDLIIKQDEINGLIGHSDFLRGNLMVTLNENRIVEEFSLPMDQLGLGKRYFVGNDYLELHNGDYGEDGGSLLEIKMETEAKHEDWFDGPLIFMQLQYLIKKSKEDEGQTMIELFLKNGTFFGQAASQEFIDERVNLLEGLYDDQNDEDIEKVLTVVNGIERVSIEEGKVVIKAKNKNSGK